MENTGIPDQVFLNFISGKHHICTRVAVKREISVSVRISMYESQGSMYLFIDHQIAGIDVYFFHSIFKLCSEHIIANFADKSRFFAKFLKHGQYIAGCTARIGFQYRISLCTCSALGKVNK